MFNKNSVFSGILLGAILPALCWAIFEYVIHNDAVILDKPAVPYLIAIALNLIILRYCYKNDMEKTANGIMMITFAFMLFVFVYKIHVA